MFRLSLLFISLTYVLFAHSNITDNLKIQLDQAGDDSTRVDLLNELSKSYRSDNPDTALHLANEALRLAKRIGYDKGQAAALNKLAIIYKRQGRADTALQLQIRGKEILEHSPHQKTLADIYNNIANLYKLSGNYEEALTYHFKSLAIRDSLGLKKEIAQSYNNIGITLRQSKMDKSALHYFRQSLAIKQALNDRKGMAATWNNIAISYDNIDSNRLALQYYRKSLVLYRQLNMDNGVARALKNIGTVHEEMGRFDSALYYYHTSLPLQTKHDDRIGLASNYNNIGSLYYTRGKPDSAIAYFHKSLDLAIEIPESSIIEKAYFNLSEVYESLGQPTRALYYFQKFSDIKDSLLNESIARSIASLPAQYEVGKREKEIRNLKSERKEKINEIRQKTLVISLLAIVMVLIVLLGVVIVFNYHQKQKNLSLNHKQTINSMLQDQAAKSLDAMINGQEKERKRIAREVHDRLGSLISTVKYHYSSMESKVKNLSLENKSHFDEVNQLIDETAREIRKIAHNMESGILTTFGLLAALDDLKATLAKTGRIQMNVIAHGLDNRLESSLEIQLFRIIQELVSNCLKHAKASQIIISLTTNDDILNIMVQDDGIGFEPDKPSFKPGMGLKNIQTRVEQLKGTWSIDSGRGNGSTIILDIPITR